MISDGGVRVQMIINEYKHHAWHLVIALHNLTSSGLPSLVAYRQFVGICDLFTWEGMATAVAQGTVDGAQGPALWSGDIQRVELLPKQHT